MKLFAWQPRGHGELSWFVVAHTQEEATRLVEEDMARRKALDSMDADRIGEFETSGWGTDYYELTIAEPGRVIINAND